MGEKIPRKEERRGLLLRGEGSNYSKEGKDC